jgi:3-deoxy-D-manno-octulosonic acid (KDO) 8-phosphate synthase
MTAQDRAAAKLAALFDDTHETPQDGESDAAKDAEALFKSR